MGYSDFELDEGVEQLVDYVAAAMAGLISGSGASLNKTECGERAVEIARALIKGMDKLVEDGDLDGNDEAEEAFDIILMPTLSGYLMGATAAKEDPGDIAATVISYTHAAFKETARAARKMAAEEDEDDEDDDDEDDKRKPSKKRDRN